ncbi:MAG: N-formylglutamate deformylase [Alphaproteobacteria bacterium]
MNPVDVHEGASPLILGIPHAGTEMPDAVRMRLNDNGLLLQDTDWHVDRLYEGLLPEATVVRARFHRYVIDANRDPSGASLYPGQNTTGLVPLTDFDGRPIWREGEEPGAEETAERLEAFHRPYHAALCEQIARVKERHGVAVLYDCHSIRSRIPFLFEGRLPDLNLGTNDGASCGPEFAEAAEAVCARADGFTHVVNGRFKGGWTTRHYGRPEDGVHAIQMELAQSAYLETEEAPFAYCEEKAGRLRPVLRELLRRLESIALHHEDTKETRRTPGTQHTS